MKLGTPRIIGIICVVISALLYFRGRGWIALAVAGIILLFTSLKYTQGVFDDFINAFSQWKTVIITALYDSLFWLLLFGSAFFLNWRLQIKAVEMQATTILDKSRLLLEPTAAGQSLGSIRSMVLFVIVGLLLLVLFNLITYTISRGLIWASIANKKADKKFFIEFGKLNLLWWLIWIPLFVFMAIGTAKTPQAISALGLILVLAYFFTPILHTLFMTGKPKGYSVSNAFAIGIAKLLKFVVPYIFAFILYIILYQLFNFVNQQPSKTIFAASMLFVVLYISWLRVYLYEVIKKLI